MQGIIPRFSYHEKEKTVLWAHFTGEESKAQSMLIYESNVAGVQASMVVWLKVQVFKYCPKRLPTQRGEQNGTLQITVRS